MAFDAGMLGCVIREIRELSLGARVEKVFQPERDEIVLQMRSLEGGKRLLINAGSNNPRMCFTGEQKENPMVPPMLCMLLRKHLQGAKLSDIYQFGFERACALEFETRDEMGFACKKYLFAEMMGKYSNLIFADENKKIISALHTVSFSDSAERQILAGVTYELPPKQDKINPLTAEKEGFSELFAKAPADYPADKWISMTVAGIAPAVAREITYRATGRTDTPMGRIAFDTLWENFESIISCVKNSNYTPSIVFQEERPVEYAYCELLQYGGDFTCKTYQSAGEMLDDFFHTRDRENHIRQKAADILKILSNAENRIRKKLDLQRGELAECEKGEGYKRDADLITANLYCLSRGMKSATLTDYGKQKEDGSFETAEVLLDSRRTPAENAQIYYKKYAKSKNAKVELSKQIALGESELVYLQSVKTALSAAETYADLSEIRDELYKSGYASRMKNYVAPKKNSAPTVAEFRTSGGFRVLCGKNNLQNEYITHKLAGKKDYWFHAKNMPGSHAVLFCEGKEPSETDFTEAAEIAAYYSKCNAGQSMEVDYTFAGNVKKPAGGKPGLVIYHTNWSCLVTPTESKVQHLRVK